MSKNTRLNKVEADALLEVTENDNLYKIAIESLSTMLYVQRMKPDYRMLYISPAFESVGYSDDEWYENPFMFRDKTHPEDVKRIEQQNRALKKNAGAESDYEYRFITKSGEVRWWHDRGKLLKSTNGEPDLWVGIIQDITEKKSAELAREMSEKQYSDLIENAHDVIYKHDLKGSILTINKAVERITDYTVEEALDLNMREFVAPEHMSAVEEQITQKLRGMETKPYEIEVLNKSGAKVALEVSSRLIYQNNEPFGIEGIARDVTERNKLIKELDRFYTLSFDMLATVDFHGNLLQINPTWERVLGYKPKEVLNKSIANIVHPDDAEITARYSKKINRGESVSFEIRMKRKDGEYRWFEWGAIPVFEDRVYYAVARDVTDRKESEKKLHYNALHDSLTNLPNRKHFMKHLDLAVERAKIEPRFRFAVLFIDLDRFKVVNDSLGHIVGDKLLIEVAEILKNCVRPSDVIARLGGDEFTVLVSLKDCDEAAMVADRIQESISIPFEIDGYEVFTSASVGIIISDDKYRKPEEFLRDADTAMYRAKDAGKAGYKIYNDEMRERSVNLQRTEGDLRRAIEQEEFRVFYQPIVNLETGQIQEFESLIRWQHPERGLVFPDQFIDLAEETGLIIPIGSWVLEESCRQIIEWEKKMGLPLRISVNLSAKELMHPFLVRKIEKVIGDSNIDPAQLKLEVTESTVMGNTDAALKTIKDLNQIGVRLSTDDFGTGYSSLSYLHLFPFERIKIDRSFVGKMDADMKSEAIIRSIMMLGQNLEIDIVAEGIENENQLWQLRSLGCKLGQGYLFSKAVPPAEIEELLDEGLPFDFGEVESPFGFSSEFESKPSIKIDNLQ